MLLGGEPRRRDGGARWLGGEPLQRAVDTAGRDRGERGGISPQAAKAAGASGFVSKDWSADEVAMAVRMGGRGMTVCGRQEEAPATPLSDREREVLTLIASGATNREIAERLYLSPHTVKEHASALYRKLGVKNRAEATRRAERLGLTR